MNRNTWIVVIVILAAWEAICRLQWVPGVILPAPSAIAAAAGDSWKEFAIGMKVTLMEMAAAALIACAIGISLGTLLGRSALASAAASPLLTAASTRWLASRKVPPRTFALTRCRPRT